MCFLDYRLVKRRVVIQVIDLDLPLLYFILSFLSTTTSVFPLSAFLKLRSLLCCKTCNALRSLRDKFGFCLVILSPRFLEGVVAESLVRARFFRSTVPGSAQNRQQKRLWLRNWRNEFEKIEPTVHDKICSQGCDAKKSQQRGLSDCCSHALRIDFPSYLSKHRK